MKKSLCFSPMGIDSAWKTGSAEQLDPAGQHLAPRSHVVMTRVSAWMQKGRDSESLSRKTPSRKTRDSGGGGGPLRNWQGGSQQAGSSSVHILSPTSGPSDTLLPGTQDRSLAVTQLQ